VKLTSHFHRPSRMERVELYPHSAILSFYGWYSYKYSVEYAKRKRSTNCFRGLALYSLAQIYQRFGGTYNLHHQGKRWRQTTWCNIPENSSTKIAGHRLEMSASGVSDTSFLFSLHFDHSNDGSRK